MFSFRGRKAYFRIVRRGGSWRVEYDGSVTGAYDSANDAVRALARGDVSFPGLPNPQAGIPGDLAEWNLGDLPPVWPRSSLPGVRTIENE